MSLCPFFGKTEYSACITVTDSPLAKPRQIVAFSAIKDQAIDDCKSMAEKEGWKPPRLWQWWRRKDSVEPFVAMSI